MKKSSIRVSKRLTEFPWERILQTPNIMPLLVLGHPTASPPTFIFIGTLGEWQPNRKLPIVAVVLSLLRKGCRKVGELVVGSPWNPREEVPKLFQLPLGACPSFVMDSLAYSIEDAEFIYSALTDRFPDVAEMLEWLREVEQRQAPTATAQAKVPPIEETHELANRLLARKTIGLEPYGVFYDAWREARERYQEEYEEANESVAEVVDEDEFQSLLSLLTKNCRRSAKPFRSKGAIT